MSARQLAVAALLTTSLAGGAVFAVEPAPIEIGSRRELFVDELLIDKLAGVELLLHRPVRREVVLVHDRPWEGDGCGYHTVFRDGDLFRMYYLAGPLLSADATQLLISERYVAYAESKDGVHWERPELGLFEHKGSKQNNIVWTHPGVDNFTPFKDGNPDCPPGERYKAVGLDKGGLWAFQSADGLRWSRLGEAPIITTGHFDSQNNAWWDPLRKHYWCFLRSFHDGVRDIRVSTSTDFRNWSPPTMLKYGDAADDPLYTNGIVACERAPHLLLGFPTRYIERAEGPSLAALPDWEHRQKRMKLEKRYGTAITDGQFMTSRDGINFRRWDESFLTPGPERKHNWTYGDCYQGLGLIETPSDDPDAPPEISLYATEDNWKRATRLRRYTLRVDGFVSLHARQAQPAGRIAPGEMLTKPLSFAGKTLTLNFATSAAGSVRVELQTTHGKPLPGYALADCDELFGDTLDRTVTWKGNPDVSAHAGQPIRLRFVLADADIYSMQFLP
jgi:hypothetical protein